MGGELASLQEYLLVAEVEDAARAGLQPFTAVAVVQQAGGEGRRQLVGVAEPVAAAVAVVAEQLVEGEVQLGAVEQRDSYNFV